MFLFLELCCERQCLPHIWKECAQVKDGKWENAEKIKHEKEQTGWENKCRVSDGVKGNYLTRRMSCRETYKDSFFSWGLEMLHLTHITPQQSGRTASLRFHMKVKSLRYKYIDRFIEILSVFFLYKDIRYCYRNRILHSGCRTQWVRERKEVKGVLSAIFILACFFVWYVHDCPQQKTGHLNKQYARCAVVYTIPRIPTLPVIALFPAYHPYYQTSSLYLIQC